MAPLVAKPLPAVMRLLEPAATVAPGTSQRFTVTADVADTDAAPELVIADCPAVPPIAVPMVELPAGRVRTPEPRPKAPAAVGYMQRTRRQALTRCSCPKQPCWFQSTCRR